MPTLQLSCEQELVYPRRPPLIDTARSSSRKSSPVPIEWSAEDSLVDPLSVHTVVWGEDTPQIVICHVISRVAHPLGIVRASYGNRVRLRRVEAGGSSRLGHRKGRTAARADPVRRLVTTMTADFVRPSWATVSSSMDLTCIWVWELCCHCLLRLKQLRLLCMSKRRYGRCSSWAAGPQAAL